jgi:hypothetical protein
VDGVLIFMHGRVKFIAGVGHNHIFILTAAASKAVSIECKMLIYESVWAGK